LLDNIRRVRDLAGGDLLRSLVLLAIWLECISEIPLSEMHPERDASAQKAVTVREVADRLHVPYETVRRHANDLVRDGYCMRVRGHGIMLAPARMKAMERPDMLAGEQARVTEFLSALAGVGFQNR
jgi:predicted transcriptional regulator of viral defense system